MVANMLFSALVYALNPEPIMSLKPGHSYKELAPFINYLEDPAHDLELTDIIAATSLKKLPDTRIGFGASRSIYWLKLPVRNDSAEPGDWKLLFKVRFMDPLSVFWIDHQGISTQILQNSPDQPHSFRGSAHRYLVTDFAIPPGQAGHLIIRYGSKGSTTLPVEILSESLLADEDLKNAVINTFFFGAILMLILINLFQFFAVSRPAYFFYSCQELLILLYITQMEGYNFVFLWPEAPIWNSQASTYLGYLTLLFPVLFMCSFLNTKNRTPLLDRAAKIFTVLVMTIVLFSPFIETITLNRTGFYMTLVMLTLLLGSGLYFVFHLHDKPARYYLAGWLAAAAGGAVLSIEQLNLISNFPISGINSIKLGALVEAIMLSAALADQVRQLKTQRDASQMQLVEVLEKRLEETEQLTRFEKDKNEALRWAQQQSDQLANATHDLRSPLYALRMAVKAQTDSQTSSEVMQFLNRNMDYMQSLLADVITNARDTSRPKVTVCNINEIFTTCAERHYSLLKEKSVSLRIAQTSAIVNTSPVLLERIIDNLLTNAVKYTHKGSILMGVRRRGECLEIQLHDTGPGLTEQQIKDALKPFVQIESWDQQSTGYGLGLSIVKSFCDQLDHQLTIHSRPGHGSVFGICIAR